ncbi:MAG: hypothetical protein ACOYL8_04435 [Patescibacteria group bacterium]
MAVELSLEKPPLKSPEAVQTKVEEISSLENKPESALLNSEKNINPVKPIEKVKDVVSSTSSQTQTKQTNQEAEIDNILSDGLNEVFLKMNPAEQVVFKKTGEETVTKINQLLLETKVRVNKIIDLIRKWLGLIPRVNKFFLEQEVKIKADKILKIKNKF